MGRAWAEQVVPQVPTEGLSVDDGAWRMTELFDDMVFAPALSVNEGLRTIALGGCPFRDVAEKHPEVVCTAHRELLHESLARLGVPAASRLRPVVEPNLCLAEIDAGLPPGR